MKKLLILTTLAMAGHSYGQETFEKYYITGGIATMPLIEQSSGNLFTGIAGLSLINPTGNIFHTHYYDIVPIHMTNVQSIRRLSENEFYFTAGLVFDSCAIGQSLKVDPVIGKIDSLGSIQAMYRYQLNEVECSNTALDLQLASNKDIITWGRYQTFFALRADSIGAVVWSRQFARNGSFGFIRELPGGDLLAGINMDTAGVSVARLSANGDMLWCKSYIRPKGLANDCLIESDSSFIITGYTDSILNGAAPLDYHPKLFMMRLDGLGQVQWCRGYDSGYGWSVTNGSRVVRTNDGNCVILGNVVTQNATRPFLMKTDPNGDTLWTRSAGVSGYGYYPVSLLEGSDGGLYYDGIVQGDFSQASSAVFLFKADSLGHLPCSEEVPPPITVSDLFPVDSSFTLVSVDGATAYPATVADAFYDPVVTYDGCTITTIPKPHDWRTRKPQIRPNPTTGHFTLSFPDPLLAESYYSVYDTMGKLLFQRPLPKGRLMEEVDLSRFAKGTYLIKFTDPSGVCFERVVVE